MNNNDQFGALIKVKILTTAAELDKQIAQLSSEIKQSISVKLKIDAKDLTLINDTMDKIKKTTQQTGGKVIIFNEKDLKDQGTKYKQGVMKTIEDVEKYLKGAFNGKKFDLGAIVKDSSGNIKSFEANIKLANNQLEKVKFNLAEIARVNSKGVPSTNSGYVLSGSEISKIAVKPEQIFNREKLDEEGRRFFFNSKNIIDRVKKEFASLGQVNVFETLNSKSKLTSFIAEVTKANGVIEKFKFNSAKIQSGSSVQSGFVFDSERLIDKNAGKNLDTLKNKMQSFTNQLERMKVGFTSPATGITDPQHLANLTAKYDQLKNTLHQVQQSSTNLSSEQRRGIVQNLADLRLQITQYKDLQRVMKTSTGGSSSTSGSLSTKDISLFQDTMTNRLAGLQVGKSTVFARPEIIAEMNRLTESIARFGTVGGLSAKEVNLQFAQLTTSVRAATAEISRINSAADSVAVTFGKDIFKLGIWALAATILYSPFRALKDGLQYVYQMDTAITDLSKVVDFSSNQLNEMADSAINLGKELGKSSVEIMQGMAEFGRITKDQNEIIELTRVATMASNVTTMTSAEAAKAITTSMITFGIEAKDSIKILNSLNEVQNNFKVSAEDMVSSISKIGAASKVAKVEMEDLEGMTAAIVQSTGISGNEAGTAIKSFMSRIYRTDMSDPEELGKTAKTLKEIANIDVTDSNGGLKGFNDLIHEIATAWVGMNEQTKIAVSQTLGSTYHYSKFVALMESYQIKLDAAAKARSSENSALDENAKKLDSISGRLGLLKVASEEFWASIINSNAIKEFVSSLTYLVSTFANLNTVLALVATGFAIFKGTAILTFFKSLPLTIRTSITSMTLFREISIANAMVADGLTTRLGFLGLSFRALGSSIKSAFLSNPLGWIVVGIASVVLAMDIYNQKQEEAIQKQKESIEVYKRQQTEISSLIESYKQNAELAKTDDNAKKQLLETEKKLKDIFGETAQGLDLQNGSIDKNVKKLNELDVANKKAFISEQKANAEKAKNALKSTNEYSASARTWNPFTSGETFNGAIFKGTIEEALVYYKNLREEINKDLHGPSLFGGDTIAQANQVTDLIKQIESELDGYNSQIRTIDDAYRFIAQSSIEGLNKLDEKQKEVYNNVKDKLTFTNEDQYKKNLQEVFDILSTWNGKNIDDLNGKLHEVDASLPPIANNAEKASSGINNTSNSLSSLQKTLSDSSSSISEIQTALSEYSETGSFSIDTLIKLAEKHKQLLAILGDEKAVRKELIKIIEDEQDKSKEAVASMLMDDDNFYKNKILLNNKLVDELHNLGLTELDQYKDLATAKAKVDESLMSELSKAWAKYYSALREANSSAVLNTFTDADPLNNGSTLDFIDAGLGRTTPTSSPTFGGFGAISEANKEFSNAMLKYNQGLENIEAEFNSIAISGSGIDFSKIGMGSGDKDKKSSSTKNDPSYTDPTSSILSEINAQSNLTAERNKAIQVSIDQAKEDKNYQLQLEKTTELMKGQQDQLSQLSVARDKINSLKDSTISSSPFGDITRWYNDQNEASTTYLSEYNSASKDTQESMEKQFSVLQKLRQAWVENKNSISETTSSLTETKSSLQSINFDIAKQSLESYDKSIDSISTSISNLKLQSEQYSQSSKEYSDNQKQQIELSKQKSQLIQDEIDHLLILISTTNLTTSAQEELNDKLSGLQSSLLSSKNETLSIYNSIADSVISTMKKAYEKQKDLAISAIEDEMEYEDSRHERKLDNLDKEMQRYQDAYDAKMKLIDDEANTEDYNANLSKSQSEAQTLQNQINVLSLDNSIESKFKRQELEEQLADKLIEIQEMQKDRERTLRKDSLSEQLDSYKEDIDAKKDAEDDKYDSIKDSLEQQKSDTEYMYNELINDERNYAKIRLQIINGNVNGIKNTMDKFLDDFEGMNKSTAEDIGESWEDILTLIEDVKSASESVKDLKSSSSSSSNSNSDSTGSSKKINVYANKTDYDNIKSSGIDLSKVNLIKIYGDASFAKEDDIVVGGTVAVPDAGLAERIGGYTAEDTLRLIKSRIASLDTGGMTPDFNGGKLAVLHGSEIINTKFDSVNLLKAMDISKTILNNFKLPDFSKLSFQPKNNEIKMENTITFNIDGSKGLSKNDLNKISNQVFGVIDTGMKRIYGI